MKKLIIILLLCASAQLHAIDIYTFGNLSHDETKLVDNCMLKGDWFSAGIGSGISTSFLSNMAMYAEAELFTEMTLGDGEKSFTPDRQDYYIRAGMWYSFIFVEYEHLCTHAVDRYDSEERSGYNRITIGFDSRRKN